MTKTELTAAAEKFVTALNANAAALTEAGKRPLYRSFAFEVGSKHARVFFNEGSSRSAVAFVSADGYIRRSDSWKKPGRILGTHDSADAFKHVAGPAF